MMWRRKILLLCLLALILAHEPSARAISRIGETAKVDISPKLGGYIPLSVTFADETGKEVKLGDIVTVPTVLSLVYLSCRHACPRLLSGLAEVLGKTNLQPGKDFTVITVSFDENDTPDVASRVKRNYLKAVGKPYPPGAWRFLTGDAGSIRKLTDSVGFHFKREKRGFTHPVTLVVISPEGKVIRYLNGVSFLPFDLEMAVTEALEGKVGSVVRRAVLFCFSYDPKGKRYVFDILKVVGVVTILVAASFVAFLVFTGKRGREKGDG